MYCNMYTYRPALPSGTMDSIHCDAGALSWCLFKLLLLLNFLYMVEY